MKITRPSSFLHLQLHTKTFYEHTRETTSTTCTPPIINLFFLQLWWQAPSFKNKHYPPNSQSIMHPYYVFKTLCFEKLPCIINKVVYPEGHGQARGMGWQEPQKFNKEKFKVLHLRSNNVGTSMLLRVTYLESSSAEKGPRRSPGGCQVENEASGLH